MFTLVLQEQVRKHMNVMMGRTCGTKDPPKSASEETVVKYQNTCEDEDGPSKDRFQPDLYTRHPENSPWNARLFEIFMVDYFQKGLPVCKVKNLSKYFMTYLKSLQVSQRKMKATIGEVTIYEAASHRNRVDQHKKTV